MIEMDGGIPHWGASQTGSLSSGMREKKPSRSPLTSALPRDHAYLRALLRTIGKPVFRMPPPSLYSTLMDLPNLPAPSPVSLSPQFVPLGDDVRCLLALRHRPHRMETDSPNMCRSGQACFPRHMKCSATAFIPDVGNLPKVVSIEGDAVKFTVETEKGRHPSFRRVATSMPSSGPDGPHMEFFPRSTPPT